MGVSGLITTSKLNSIVSNSECCAGNYYNTARVKRAEGLSCWGEDEAKGKKIEMLLWAISLWGQNAQGYPDSDNYITQAQLNAAISELKGKCGCGTSVTIPTDEAVTVVEVLDFKADNGDYIAV